jgi:hypothetical protein
LICQSKGLLLIVAVISNGLPSKSTVKFASMRKPIFFILTPFIVMLADAYFFQFVVIRNIPFVNQSLNGTAEKLPVKIGGACAAAPGRRKDAGGCPGRHPPAFAAPPAA